MRYLSIITEAATYMSQLIDDLLEFSRMGCQEIKTDTIELRKLIEHSWKSLVLDCQGRDASLEILGELPSIQGDPALLTMAFNNLLSNAIKYHPHTRKSYCSCIL